MPVPVLDGFAVYDPPTSQSRFGVLATLRVKSVGRRRSLKIKHPKASCLSLKLRFAIFFFPLGLYLPDTVE